MDAELYDIRCEPGMNEDILWKYIAAHLGLLSYGVSFYSYLGPKNKSCFHIIGGDAPKNLSTDVFLARFFLLTNCALSLQPVYYDFENTETLEKVYTYNKYTYKDIKEAEELIDISKGIKKFDEMSIKQINGFRKSLNSFAPLAKIKKK